MVKIYTSLLAVTLATGSALASSNDYERRSELHPRYGLACAGRGNFGTREFVDEEDLFVRDQDDLEAREPLGSKAIGSAFKLGKEVAGHKHTKNAFKAIDYGSQAYNVYTTVKQSRGFEDDEDIFVRDMDDLEAREPLGSKAFGSAFKIGKSAFKLGKKASEHKHTKNAFKAFDYGSQAYNAYTSLRQRGFEDDEDIFVRDVDDLEAREPFFGTKAIGSAFKTGFRLGKKASEHKHTKNAFKAFNYGSQAYNGYTSLRQRGFEDDEDIFVRDLDAEELFERDFDLLDERDTIEDLD